MFIAGQLLLINIFAYLYSFYPLDFGFETSIDPLYFSFITQTSVGYGDFSPKTTRSKILVMCHSFLSLILFAESLSIMYSND
tara:strand:- start:224 stop:469 length:246 start_codon:yes stop_codon:yes gene_type:complete